MRADELGLHGDLRSGLLYEVAHKRQENVRLKADLATAQQALIILQHEREELALRTERLEGEVLDAREATVAAEARWTEVDAKATDLQQVSA